jgi:hypothetical protein
MVNKTTTEVQTQQKALMVDASDRAYGDFYEHFVPQLNSQDTHIYDDVMKIIRA